MLRTVARATVAPRFNFNVRPLLCSPAMPRREPEPESAPKRVSRSYGPDWDAALAFGIDGALLEENLAMTPQQRLEALMDLIRLAEENDRARERLRGSKK